MAQPPSAVQSRATENLKKHSRGRLCHTLMQRLCKGNTVNSNRMMSGLFVVAALVAGVLSAGCEHSAAPSQSVMSANPRNAVIDAIATLRQAAESADPVVRSNAIEALAETVGDKEGGLYLQALNEKNPMVQFAGAMAIGDTRYAPAKEKLSQMADQAGPDKRVYAAVIYALYRLGDTSHMPDMVRLLQHREMEVRADAVMVLGKIGEPSAIYPLRAVLNDEREPRVELNIVEALAMLGEGDSSTRLERYARQRFFDQQLVIIPVIAHVRP
ncbi:MAG: HEAT repeat domain-containing protein, partial [Planctomycetaceae bacterium]